MRISPFLLERHFAKYEFDIPFQLSCSDCEPLALAELLEMASTESIGLWQNLKLSYTESQGNTLLREEISQTYDGIKPEEIIVCAPEEGIFLVMNSLLSSGDHLIVISPAYQSLSEIALSIGCQVSHWKADLDGQYRVKSMESLITSKTRMVVINFPHNPTGALISRAEFIEITQLCTLNGILLFSDEMYRGLEQDISYQLPCAAALSPGNISLSGMSKSFALPGLRIGWLVCRNPGVREELIQMKDYTTICASAPSEILAIIALKNRDRILKRNLQIIKKNIIMVNEFIDRNTACVCWNEPKAGSVALLNLLNGLSSEELCKDLLEKQKVLAIGSHLFRFHEPAIRLGLGRIGFEQALKKLEDYLFSVVKS